MLRASAAEEPFSVMRFSVMWLTLSCPAGQCVFLPPPSPSSHSHHSDACVFELDQKCLVLLEGHCLLPLTGVFHRLACKSNAGCLRVFCCARVSFFFYIFPTAVMGLNMTPLWCSRFCPTSGHLLIKTTSGGGGGRER